MTDQPDLFSVLTETPGKVRRDHPATSRAAAYGVTPRTGTQRRRVLDAIAHRPQTDEELQASLAMSGNTERPRRVELVEGGWIRDSGERRATSTGADSVVWCLTEHARNELRRVA